MTSIRSYLSPATMAVLVVGAAAPGCRDADPPAPYDELLPLRSFAPRTVVGDEAEHETALTPIADMSSPPRGDLYLVLPMDGTVRRFTADGDFVGDIGRPGDGPGEFRGPAHMGWVSDTLWVWDQALHRLTLFTPDGNLVRSVALPSRRLPPFGATVARVFVIGEDQLVAESSVPGKVRATGLVDARPLWRLSQEGEIIDTLALLDVSDNAFFRITLENGSETLGSNPIRDYPVFDVSPSGEAIVIVDRRVALAAGPSTFRMTKIGREGDTIFSRQYGYNPTAVPDEHVDALVDGAFVEPAYGPPPFTREELRRAMWVPEFFPPVATVQLSSDGSIWVARETLQDSIRPWDVFDAMGKPLFRVRLARNVRPFVVYRNRIWARRRGVLDVPQAVEYVLRNGREG